MLQANACWARYAVIWTLLLMGAPPTPAVAQEPNVLSLDSLLNVPVSTAGKYAQSIRDAPASVSIITAEEIAAYGWTTLPQVLDGVRGFYTSYDRSYNYLGVRGFGRSSDYSNRILVLLDGHTLNEGVWGSAPTGTELAIDLSALERIEIVRGPGSALYGSSAMLAVINLITKSGAGANETRVRASTGSYGTRQATAAFDRSFASGLDVAASAMWTDIDGQTLYYPEYAGDSATGGTVRGLDWDRQRGALVRLGYHGFTLQGRYAWRGKGVPTGSFDQAFGDPRAATWDEGSSLELAWAGEVTPSLHVRSRAYYDGYWYRGDYPGVGFLYSEASKGEIIGSEASLRWDLGSRNRVTVGGEYRNNIVAQYFSPPKGAPDFFLSRPYTVASTYLQDELDITSWLTLLGGVRYDHHSLAGGALSPRAAVVMRPDQFTSVKLLYGEAFRAPTIYERDYATTSYKGNPGLNPERIRTYELLAQRQLSRGTLATVSFFTYKVDGLIDIVLDPTDSLYQHRNGGGDIARGVEAEVETRFAGGLFGYVNGSFTRAYDQASGADLTNSPGLLLKAGLTMPLHAGFGLGGEAAYQSSRRTEFGSETRGFLLANANLRWSPTGRWSHLEASLRVNNLFNTGYANPGGLEHLQAAIGQDGRNLLFSLGARF
jgi:iron complex outermembrane receptor protein